MAVTSQRYKDVLFALATAHQYEVALGRLQLQKYVYLNDTISILWEILAPKYAHKTYKNGPYDQGIQNAVDILAFRGFVQVVQSSIRIDGSVSSSYRISEFGLKLVDMLTTEDYFARKFDVYHCIGEQVQRRGWDKLKDLVYSEVTYSIKRGDSFGQYLQVNSLLTNESMRIIMGFNTLLEDKSARFSRYNLVILFFQFLDNYHSIKQQLQER